MENRKSLIFDYLFSKTMIQLYITEFISQLHKGGANLFTFHYITDFSEICNMILSGS